MIAPEHSRSLILCVDDQATTLELRKRVLQKTGYRVLTATSAHKALELFSENHVDVVLMEHVVANHEGSALAATMKMLRHEVPIAIYSADCAESPEDMRVADIFITKLASVDELLRTIERLLIKGQITKAAFPAQTSDYEVAARASGRVVD